MSLATDHASEGRFNKEFTKVLNVPTEYRPVRSRKQLLS